MENSRFNAGHLEILARLKRFGRAVHLNNLMGCDYECLSDLRERGLVSEKTDGNLTTYELTIRGNRYASEALAVEHSFWQEKTY